MNSKERRQYDRHLYRTIVDLVSKGQLYFVQHGSPGFLVTEILSPREHVEDDWIAVKYTETEWNGTQDIVVARHDCKVRISRLFLSAKENPDWWEKVSHYASTQFRKK